MVSPSVTEYNAVKLPFSGCLSLEITHFGFFQQGKKESRVLFAKLMLTYLVTAN